MSSQIATTLEVYVYAEDGITPINAISIELKPTNTKISPETQSSNPQGKITFTNPIGSNEFYLIVKDERFYPNAKNDIKRVTNSFTTTNNTVTLNLIPKIWLYFNGKELYIHQGNKVIQSFQAFSGKALSLKQKEQLQRENGYKHFVEYKDKELLSSTTNYFCLDKVWQKEKDKGAIPEGEYYVNINESKDNKIDSGIRIYENAPFSTSRSKEGEGKWGQYNIPIYTNKNCTNTIESNTQRDSFYIHGGESYGNNGGIDLGKEENFFIMLQKLRDEMINKNYESNDKPIVIDLIVDYSHMDIRVESIDIKRIINTNNPYNINDTHMVILTANFSPKAESMSEKVYNTKKLQTLWGYKEILQTEEFNPNEIGLSDIELFPKNRIINTLSQEANDNPTQNTNNQANTSNTHQTLKQYQGETLEIDLVANEWHHYDRQIVVFAYTGVNLTSNDNSKVLLENDPPRRVITWFNPITNPQITIYTQSQINNPQNATFMHIRFYNYNPSTQQRDIPRPHQGIDLFANIGTPVYACLDGKVIKKRFATGYGNGILIAITGLNLEIMKYKLRNSTYSPYYIESNLRESDREANFDENSEVFYLYYAHLNTESMLENGEEIVAGQIIGYSGVSGFGSTYGPHLHFEVSSSQNNGIPRYRINPAYFFHYKNHNELTDEERNIQYNASRILHRG